MNEYEVAGILQTYAEKCTRARNTKHLRRMVKNLKEILDLRTIRKDEEDDK